MDPSAPRPDLPPFVGKYRVRALLGEGSMGLVLLAHDPGLERNVAVKMMAGAALRDPKLRDRFELEARAVARLHHPNIVTVHDLGWDENGAPFLAMELLKGSDLHHLVRSHALSLGEKLSIVVQVCRGLGHAHRNDIVHRDIKPANIFVLEDGTAKIMDFGVSRWLQRQKTQAGLVVGTAGYISPEQLRGRPVDGRADLFSLGVVLFEILTQQMLFSGESIETVFFKTLGKETPRLLAPNGEELPVLQSVLDRALMKDVEKRYRTADEMESSLLAFLDGHRSLLGETRPFTAGEGESFTPVRRKTSPKAPTRMVSAASIAPRPQARSKRALLAAVIGGFAVALAAFLPSLPDPTSPPKPPPARPALRPVEPPPSRPTLTPSASPGKNLTAPPPAAPEARTISKPTPPRSQPSVPTPQRSFVEGRTEYRRGRSAEDPPEVLGFEAEPGFEIGETVDAFFPAQVLLELTPRDAKTGEPYRVRVSIFNEGYRPLRIAELALVSRFEGRTSGKGQAIATAQDEVPPKATVLIHEVAGTWKESWNEGEIEAVVTLMDGASLTKRLSWRPSRQ